MVKLNTTIRDKSHIVHAFRVAKNGDPDDPDDKGDPTLTFDQWCMEALLEKAVMTIGEQCTKVEFCSCCGKPINDQYAVWLEKSLQSDMFYRPDNFPVGDDSLGTWPFGEGCARNQLANSTEDLAA